MKCCDILPGMLRYSIQLQSLTNTPDGIGGFTTAWTTYATVRAKMDNVSGAERVFNERLNAEVTVKATIRYRSDIKESDRVVFGSSGGGGGDEVIELDPSGKVYQIRHIDNIEFRNRWMVLSLDGGVAT